MTKVAIIGAGTWGTTIAKICAENGSDVSLWAYQSGTALEINRNHTHRRLPGLILPSNITATTEFEDCMKDKDMVVIALSSSQFEHVETFKKYMSDKPILILTKGLAPDQNTLFVSDYFKAQFPSNSIGILSGPNIAIEIAQKKPAASTVATQDDDFGILVQEVMSNDYLRIYRSNDIRGVELGGVLKNIIAIAAGIADGLELGTNAKSALISRGLVEMIAVADYIGAKKDTLYGLSGLGDLVTTCFSNKSRNWKLGFSLAKKLSVNDALENLHGVAEGVKTTKIMAAMAKEQGWELPIITGVYNVMFNNDNPAGLIKQLMNRSLREE